MLGELPAPGDALARAAALDVRLGEVVQPLLGPVLAPTIMQSGSAANVVPGSGELTCSCRLLPGQTSEQTRRIVADLLGPSGYELEIFQEHGGTRSPLDTPFWRALERFVEARRSRARSSFRTARAGFTDSHWLREAFGTVAYGFFPLRDDARARRRRADPLGGRAHPRRRPRARRRAPARGGARGLADA